MRFLGIDIGDRAVGEWDGLRVNGTLLFARDVLLDLGEREYRSASWPGWSPKMLTLNEGSATNHCANRFGGPGAERPTRGGQDQSARFARLACPERLEDRRVLAVHWNQLGAVLSSQLRQDRPREHVFGDIA